LVLACLSLRFHRSDSGCTSETRARGRRLGICNGKCAKSDSYSNVTSMQSLSTTLSDPPSPESAAVTTPCSEPTAVTLPDIPNVIINVAPLVRDDVSHDDVVSPPPPPNSPYLVALDCPESVSSRDTRSVFCSAVYSDSTEKQTQDHIHQEWSDCPSGCGGENYFDDGSEETKCNSSLTTASKASITNACNGAVSDSPPGSEPTTMRCAINLMRAVLSSEAASNSTKKQMQRKELIKQRNEFARKRREPQQQLNSTNRMQTQLNKFTRTKERLMQQSCRAKQQHTKMPRTGKGRRGNFKISRRTAQRGRL